MGRKIPGKKHRTIKDPYKQRQKRIDSLRLKVNNPPSNSDEQEIPKSLLKIMEFKQKANQKVRKKSKKRKNGLLSVAKLLDKDQFQPGMTRPITHMPNLVQKPQESPIKFLNRVHLMTQELINEAEFEKKFGVEIKKNPETGRVIEVKKVKKSKKSKKKKLSDKRKEKISIKRTSSEDIKDFSQLQDKVEFGEVVHRPPNFSNIKKLNKETTEKNRYKNLLLNNLMSSPARTTNKLPGLEWEKAEKERKFIVEAYRRAKKERNL